MSLIHDALKKAEGEKGPKGLNIKPLTNPILPGKKLPKNRLILYGILLLLSIGLLIYLRILRKPGSGIIPEPKQTFSAPTPLAAQNPLQLKEKATSLYEQNQLEEALILWEQLTILLPTDAEIYNNMGLTYKKLGKLDLAYQSYNKALALQEEYPEAINNLGVLLLSENRLKQAALRFQDVLALKPDYADPYFNYALLLEQEGKYREAKRHYRLFLEKAGNIDPKLQKQVVKKMRRLELR